MVLLRTALLYEELKRYLGWYTEMKNLITQQDEKDLQLVVDKILSRNKEVVYFKEQEVEIDM